ncbi:MAG: tryptophan synthase subunit alpha [Alphaproteobacteria bacterium]|nr:tryptophan synthase subunit alpha [Alphaproteobacteria bacterium]
MTNRIDTVFAALKAQGRAALVTFITAGDPDVKKSLEVLKSLPAAGADIIELGMPFTDPMADGPTIQASSLRALASGASMQTTLQMVRDFRTSNTTTPIVLMGYANPCFQYGFEKFAKDAAAAGADGLIIVDLPPEEDDALLEYTKPAGLHLIKLVTPTTTDARLKAILPKASGFLYYVSITGITGAASADIPAVKKHIESIRKHTDLPVAAGFGIKTPDDVAAFKSAVDAVVVGSAIVEKVSVANDAMEFVKTLRAAL